jgi:hypothetical protein
MKASYVDDRGFQPGLLVKSRTFAIYPAASLVSEKSRAAAEQRVLADKGQVLSCLLGVLRRRREKSLSSASSRVDATRRTVCG